MDQDLNVGARVHLIAGHMDGMITGLAPKTERQRNGTPIATVPGAWVLWDGEEEPALWALYELEPAPAVQ